VHSDKVCAEGQWIGICFLSLPSITGAQVWRGVRAGKIAGGSRGLSTKHTHSLFSCRVCLLWPGHHPLQVLGVDVVCITSCLLYVVYWLHIHDSVCNHLGEKRPF
jgi:hypothetical protein